MRIAGLLCAALLAGCSGPFVRLGSDTPPGVPLTDGRVIESADCQPYFFHSQKDYGLAYQALVTAARGDLITDVEVSERPCLRMRARAVKVALPEIVRPAVPTLAAGGRARLRDGAVLRARPLPDAEVLRGDTAQVPLILKASIQKDTGTWWYVTRDGGAGWARDSDLEPVGPQ